MLIFLLILSAGIVLADFPPSCMKLIDMKIFLYDCCQYPVIPGDIKIYDKCVKQCGEFNYCCFQECTATQIGVYVNDTLDVEIMKSTFAEQLEHGKYTNVSENWSGIIEKSIAKCAVSRDSDQLVCEYIYELIACIFKENFLSCPKLKDKSECRNVQTNMAECGKEKRSWRFITDAFNFVQPNYARRYAEKMDFNVTTGK